MAASSISVKTPDRNGALTDVVLGHDDLAGYLGGLKTFFVAS